jgi:hypothetical protein
MQPGWIYIIYLLDKYDHTLYNTNDYPHKEPNMDDLALLTIGKLYLELTNYQRVIEAQRVKIAELESQVAQPAPAFGAAKTKIP